MNELIKADQIKAITDYHIQYYNKAVELDNIITNWNEDCNSLKKSLWQFYPDYHHKKNNVKTEIKISFCREIMQIDKLRNTIIDNDYYEMLKSFEKLAQNKDFIISEATAHQLIASFYNNGDEIIKKQLKTCYLILTNNTKNINKDDKYKTVETFKIGKKSVVCRSDYSQHIPNIIKCFNLISNKDVDYRLYDGGSKNCTNNYDSNTFICEYFEAKLYKNGTAHITYTDLETVKKFNSYVGKFFNYLGN
jgi:hypothetical protein